jgi:hypothetical protein
MSRSNSRARRFTALSAVSRLLHWAGPSPGPIHGRFNALPGSVPRSPSDSRKPADPRR